MAMGQNRMPELEVIKLLGAIVIADGPYPTSMLNLSMLFMIETGETIPSFGFATILEFMQASGEFLVVGREEGDMLVTTKLNPLSRHVVNSLLNLAALGA